MKEYMKGFDDWACDQEVEYTLVAKVNDQVAFKASSADIDTIVGQANKAEYAVAELLNDQYQDILPDYDEEAKLMRMQEAGEI
jgi:hypothetical protein